ncbi:MAG: hypothetical protein INQ03_15720 [Candidatus Heimdallarchaeota archaeon]|nr:hypothetical protein [Candidatus Heimdallarchaeota archaeon]
MPVECIGCLHKEFCTKIEKEIENRETFQYIQYIAICRSILNPNIKIKAEIFLCDAPIGHNIAKCWIHEQDFIIFKKTDITSFEDFINKSIHFKSIEDLYKILEIKSKPIEFNAKNIEGNLILSHNEVQYFLENHEFLSMDTKYIRRLDEPDTYLSGYHLENIEDKILEEHKKQELEILSKTETLEKNRDLVEELHKDILNLKDDKLDLSGFLRFLTDELGKMRNDSRISKVKGLSSILDGIDTINFQGYEENKILEHNKLAKELLQRLVNYTDYKSTNTEVITLLKILKSIIFILSSKMEG